jgi:hypothetical protein
VDAVKIPMAAPVAATDLELPEGFEQRDEADDVAAGAVPSQPNCSAEPPVPCESSRQGRCRGVPTNAASRAAFPAV